MPSEIDIHAVYQGEMRITAHAGEHSVTMDYPIQPGNAGCTPLQLLLVSLAGCSGNSLALLLRKMQQPVTGLEVEVHGVRRDEHPTVITDIALEFVVRGTGVDPEAVARALALSEGQLCPVWAMLKPGTKITSSFRVVEG